MQTSHISIYSILINNHNLSDTQTALRVSFARYAFCGHKPFSCILLGESPKTPNIYIGVSLFDALFNTPLEKVRHFLTHLYYSLPILLFEEISLPLPSTLTSVSNSFNASLAIHILFLLPLSFNSWAKRIAFSL